MENKEMNIELIKLKIKAKSLAEEARIIRKEERKLKEIPFHKRSKVVGTGHSQYVVCHLSTIQLHRKWYVRNEARATQLAIAYIKGKDYLQVEKSTKSTDVLRYYIVPRILAMVKKYGEKETTREDILKWIE